MGLRRNKLDVSVVFDFINAPLRPLDPSTTLDLSYTTLSNRVETSESF